MTTRTQDMYGGAEPPPWDIGRPQQAFIDLVARGEILGDVLDVGCGTGALARYLIATGRSVQGIDLSPVAIKQAAEAYLGVPDSLGIITAFRVHSALDLPALGRKFDSVVDCGLLHQFSDEDRTTYLTGVLRVLRAGGHYYALIWSDQAPARERGPRRYSQKDVIGAFNADTIGRLYVLSLRPAVFENRTDPVPTPAWLIIAEKL